MKVTQVSYLKTFPLGQFINEKIEIVVSIGEGDDVQSALSLARSECELNHKTNNPHLYQEQETSITQYEERINALDNSITYSPIPTQPLTQEQKFLNLIQLATSIKELSMYEKTANNPKYPQLKQAYDNKLNQLTK